MTPQVAGLKEPGRNPGFLFVRVLVLLLASKSQASGAFPHIPPVNMLCSEFVPMILFPAIDLKDGQCVRLKLGDMNQATVFNDNPAAQAKAFEDQGFEYLHVVDL